MTLSAITADFELFNPSALINSGKDRTRIVLDMRNRQKNGLYCPHCYRSSGDLIPVNFRNTETKRPHFFHLHVVEDGKECTNYSGEGEKHDAAKTFLEQFLQKQGAFEVLVDKIYVVADDGRKRKPDLLVTYELGQREGHEIQISPINSTQLEERTNDIRDAGVQRVVWYLYGKNFNKENRAWCCRNNVPCYHLKFDYANIPTWTLDDAPKEAIAPPSSNSSSANAKDECRFDRASWYPQIGDKVCKRYNLGWVGNVVRMVESGVVEVHWQLEPYPSRVRVDELRPKEVPFGGYKRGSYERSK